MKNILFLILLGYSFIFAGCKTKDITAQQPQEEKKIFFQYSTIDALLQGLYDGQMLTKELLEHGDFGLGTFNALDGEMIVLDGVVYQVATDGVARVMPENTTIPFATITTFKADKNVTTTQDMNCSQLHDYIDTLLPEKDIPYAIKIDGVFTYIQTRSVPKQQKPYPPLADVIEKQKTFDFFQQDGTIVGFKMPTYIGTLNAQGYHFHFLTHTKQAGGHVLQCRTQNISIEIDYLEKWEIELLRNK